MQKKPSKSAHGMRAQRQFWISLTNDSIPDTIPTNLSTHKESGMEQKKSQIRKESVFCLGFFIEKADERKSGFKPADQDEGGKLYCDLRMEGVAALLRIGFAKKVVVLGGNEKRITTTNIRRGRAIQKMLIDDFGADPDRVEAIDCSP